MEENNKSDSEEKNVAATLIGFSSLINNKIDSEKSQDDTDILNGLHLMLNAVNTIPDVVKDEKENNSTSPKEVKIDIKEYNEYIASPGSVVTMEEYIEVFNNALDKIDKTGQLKILYNKSIAQSHGTYIPPVLVEFLIEKLNITSSDILYEFESGIGSVLLQLACRTFCKCFGSETKDYEFTVSTKLYNLIESELAKNEKKIGKINLHHGDPLDQFNTLKSANIILMLGNSIQSENKNYMENVFLNTLNHGTRVVTRKELFPRVKSKNARFTNSFASLFNYNYDLFYDEVTKSQILVYTVDRESRNKRGLTSDNIKKFRQPKVNANDNISMNPLSNYIKDRNSSDKIEEFVSLQNLNSNMLSLILLSFNYEPVYVDNILDDEYSKIDDIIPLYSVEKQKKYPEGIRYTLCDRECSNFVGSKLGYKINVIKKGKRKILDESMDISEPVYKKKCMQ